MRAQYVSLGLVAVEPSVQRLRLPKVAPNRRDDLFFLAGGVIRLLPGI
jgi:hypothetical protein